jgi:hypothetical protein
MSANKVAALLELMRVGEGGSRVRSPGEVIDHLIERSRETGSSVDGELIAEAEKVGSCIRTLEGELGEMDI